MIHHTITSMAITTLHLAFVTFTVDIYRTDAAIWSQTETTTDWQDHFSGKAYRQMATTNTPESFTNVASTVSNQFTLTFIGKLRTLRGLAVSVLSRAIAETALARICSHV